jgi:3-deoxy-D-manno-octulosonic-acid transferase
MKPLYDLFLLLYPLGARLLSIKNEKATKWLKGRHDIFGKIKAEIVHDKKIIWVHASSLGEFEQGRPLIEKLTLKFPGTRIFLTFFSPSGYEVQKDYKGAEWVFYLPLDSKENAKKFFDLVQPSLIIFIKYDFWFYYLNEAKQRNIPMILASAIFRESQPFFKWYGDFHRKMLQCFSLIFVQSKESVELLKSIDITNVELSGDTRFDRVLEIANNFQPINIIEQFCGNHPVVVAGSTWSEDDKELEHYANANQHIKFIIAPHQISKARIAECLSLYKNAVTLSSLSSSNIQYSTFNTLIIDNIGMLSKLYNYATIAYVGGGFGDDGVHNVVEAAVYGKPVVFGPVYEKYIEAKGLEESGGGFSVTNALELEKQLDKLFDDAVLYKQACNAAANFVKENAGATEKIIDHIQLKRLLTV